MEGKLIIDDLTENAHRVRRNLLIFSFLAIFYKLSGASIDKDVVSFYGINFYHIDEAFISFGIYSIVFYHFFHFSLIVIAHWQYLGIRVTRSDVKVKMPSNSTISDHPLNSRDSNLYTWYTEKIPQLNSKFNYCYQKIEEFLEAFNAQEGKSITETRTSLMERELDITHKLLNREIDSLKEMVAPRVLSSLKKFDKSLKCYKGVELFRWIFIEFLIPMLAGIVAVILLLF